MINKNNKFSYYIKDNIWVKEFPTTASSVFLFDYYPGTDSSLKKYLDESKLFSFLGKCDLDELACGWSGLLSKSKFQKEIYNPFDKRRIIGGSSSESAFLVASKKCNFSIGTDTGGSIIVPSAYSGIIGFKPSYGSISRYGLIPLSSSLDTVGILSSDIKVLMEAFSILSRVDCNDLITISRRKLFEKKKRFEKNIKKIALVKDLDIFLKEDIKKKYLYLLNCLEKEGYILDFYQLPEFIKKGIYSSYFIISCTELFSHFNSLQGITFGVELHEKKMSIEEKRSIFLGKEVKKRLLMGSFFLEEKKYLEKARKIRFQINNWINQIFINNNSFCFIFPTLNHIAPEAIKVFDDDLLFADILTSNANFLFDDVFSDIFNEVEHWTNNLFLLSNFSGTPSISIPFGFSNNLPFGISLVFFHGEDKEMLEFSKFILKLV